MVLTSFFYLSASWILDVQPTSGKLDMMVRTWATGVGQLVPFQLAGTSKFLLVGDLMWFGGAEVGFPMNLQEQGLKSKSVRHHIEATNRDLNPVADSPKRETGFKPTSGVKK